MTVINRDGKDYEVRSSGTKYPSNNSENYVARTTYIVIDKASGIFVSITIETEDTDKVRGEQSIEDFLVGTAIPTLENEYYREDFINLVNAFAVMK